MADLILRVDDRRILTAAAIPGRVYRNDQGTWLGTPKNASQPTTKIRPAVIDRLVGAGLLWLGDSGYYLRTAAGTTALREAEQNLGVRQ